MAADAVSDDVSQRTSPTLVMKLPPVSSLIIVMVVFELCRIALAPLGL